MTRLNQGTIAVIGVGIALGALILTTTGGLRDELRAVRAEPTPTGKPYAPKHVPTGKPYALKHAPTGRRSRSRSSG